MAAEGERRGPKLSEAAQVAEAERQRRLGDAMRENLRKRKRQQRAAAAGKSTAGDRPGDGGEPG